MTTLERFRQLHAQTTVQVRTPEPQGLPPAWRSSTPRPAPAYENAGR
jgi:hypothetical protein